VGEKKKEGRHRYERRAGVVVVIKSRPPGPHAEGGRTGSRKALHDSQGGLPIKVAIKKRGGENQDRSGKSDENKLIPRTCPAAENTGFCQKAKSQSRTNGGSRKKKSAQNWGRPRGRGPVRSRRGVHTRNTPFVHWGQPGSILREGHAKKKRKNVNRGVTSCAVAKSERQDAACVTEKGGVRRTTITYMNSRMGGMGKEKLRRKEDEGLLSGLKQTEFQFDPAEGKSNQHHRRMME